MINNNQDFIDQFNKFYKENKYISKKDYLMFFSNNEKLIKEDSEEKLEYIKNNIDEILKKHNEVFIENALIEEKEYFDDMFKNIDENINLDKEQRKAILNDEDYSLIIAGAGSGKTTTMAGKVKYLVDRKKAEEKDILMISFTNKAVNELKERVNQGFNINCDIVTFHKLGCNIIKDATKSNLNIISETESHTIIKEYLEDEILKNKKNLSEILYLFNNYIDIEEDYSRFNNIEEYHKYKTEKQFVSLKEKVNDYNKFVINQRRAYYRTILSEFLRSKEEVRIANFLYMNNISYTYEKDYEYKTDDDSIYKPDFYIEQGENKLYIEHFNVSESKKNKDFNEEEMQKYLKSIEEKQEIHQKNNTKLVTLYSSYNDEMDYVDKLKDILIKNNFVLTLRDEEEIYKKLMETSTANYFDSFINYALEFIKKAKSFGIKDISELKKETRNKKMIHYITVLEKIFNYYQEKLEKNNKIDFSDMINLAIENIEKTNKKYKYIIIDEYQDISKQRYNLIKKICEKFESKVVAVGDDWQSIFSFSGSDISLFTKFKELMGYAEELIISNTYRNSQELIDVAGEFINKNKKQINKKLYSEKHLEKPVVVYPFDDKEVGYIIESKIRTILEIIKEIYIKNPNQNILLIGRYKSDIDSLINSQEFEKGEKDKVICLDFPRADITFLTAHKSKGLGFDNVIILNAVDDKFGFPSKVKNDPIFDLIEKENDSIEFAEERRLFYVAITRTKNKTYIITPMSKPSKFITEIKCNVNVLFKNDLIDKYENTITNQKCPNCDFYLEKIYSYEMKKWYYRCTNEKEICDFSTTNLERKVPITKCRVCEGYIIDKGYVNASKTTIIAGCTNYDKKECMVTKFYKNKN